MKIKIYINSSGRAGNVKTVNQFPDSWKEFTQIVVPHDQYKDYKKKESFPILRIKSTVPSYLSSQRQWVMENSDADIVWMMDDDLSFMTRNSEMKLKKSTTKQMKQMLKAMKLHLKEIPIVGISTRLGNNRVEDDYADITRVTRCFAIDRKVFNEVGETMAPFEPFCMQDFHINLCFLKKGHPNRVMYNYAQGDSGSNSKGGCSNYRTSDVLATVSKWMAKKHRGFVTVKQKKTKGSWEGFEKDADGFVTRTDVIIHWKKAYRKRRDPNSGLAKYF